MIRFTRLGLLVVVMATLAVSGCSGIGPGRTASGTTASKRLDASGVTRLDVAYGFDVHVGLGRPEAVTVTYDDNLADLLDVGVDGRTLRIQLKPHPGHIGNRPTLRADVTIGRLEEARVAGGSTVDVAGPAQDPGLRLLVSGGSRVTADLGTDRADATVSGNSRLTLTGSAGTLEVDGSGSSDLELAELSLQHLDIQLSGASQANVQADKTIAAQLSGASGLTYIGTPRFTKQDTSGASTIQPART
jgi:Putative auto-transporter adhesin, head GIN domain